MTRKQTSDRVSRIAARVLREAEHGRFWWIPVGGGHSNHRNVTATIKALAASVLSQDETKGERGKVRK